MGRVEGKVALVTGGASGLGLADVQRLAEEGASVILTDVNDEAGTAAAEKIASETGQRVAYRHLDVSSADEWQDTVTWIEKEFGRLDVLVNNAGVVIVATPEETTLEQFRFANAVMNEGVFVGCKTCLPLMTSSGGGSIINMSSTASHMGFPVFFAYSAAKGAVRSMTKSLAVYCQMARNNIRCNSIHAGAIDTPMVANANAQLGVEPPGSDDEVGLGEPRDVANMVLYLASDESRFVNGAELMIDNCVSIRP